MPQKPVWKCESGYREFLKNTALNRYQKTHQKTEIRRKKTYATTDTYQGQGLTSKPTYITFLGTFRERVILLSSGLFEWQLWKWVPKSFKQIFFWFCSKAKSFLLRNFNQHHLYNFWQTIEPTLQYWAAGFKSMKTILFKVAYQEKFGCNYHPRQMF